MITIITNLIVCAMFAWIIFEIRALKRASTVSDERLLGVGLTEANAAELIAALGADATQAESIRARVEDGDRG